MFKQVLSSIFVLFLCVGCVSYTRTAPDGSSVAARGKFMKVGDIVFSEVTTNGVERRLSVKELSPDVQALEAVARGIAEGMISSGKNVMIP